MKSFLVLGLGRFGKSLACTLYSMGHEVMAMDDNEEVVSDMADCVTHVLVGDCTDEAVLRSVGVRNFDVAIVAIGGDMQSSIMITLILKEAGVRKIIAKAQSEIHAKILEKVGADRVIFPEQDMGERVAQMLTINNFLDYIELSPEYSIIETTIPSEWAGKTLSQLDIRRKHGINVMAVKSGGEIHVSPAADFVLGGEDIIVVIGKNDSIGKLYE